MSDGEILAIVNETNEAAPPPIAPTPPVEFPGKIALAHERGHYTGCLVKCFAGPNVDEQINEYFAQNGGLLVVDFKFDGQAALVTFSKSLSDDELDDIAFFGAEINQHMAQRKADKAAARGAALAKAQEAELELKRLAELGRTHEANCKKVKEAIEDVKSKHKKGKR